MKFKLTILLISQLVLFNIVCAIAQQRGTISNRQGDKIEHSEDILMGKKLNGENVNILVGNVKFTQPTKVITCDSAVFYPSKNSLEAFGKVKIFDKTDSTVITSKKLIYEGNEQKARIRENVVYRRDSVQLFTEFLDYDMINRSANYFNGGRVLDNVNELTSENGFYDTEANVVTFTKDVVVNHPDFVLEAEDLVYNLITKIAVINSPNTITRRDGTVLNAEQGSEFNIGKNTSVFIVTEIESESYILYGDQISFDDEKKYYVARGNVRMLGKENEIIIEGEQAHHWKKDGVTIIFGHPVMKKHAQNDTLYLAADTLHSIDSEIKEEQKMLAYHHVKIYRKGLQGKADSMSYHISDSIIFFYNDPILWNDETQITGDSINVTIENSQIKELITKGNAFIISEDSTENYNQLKGREMVSHFKDNKISSVNVFGNGESNYYAIEEETNELMGMNNIICSSMKIRFVNNSVNNISYYTKPVGKFIPMHELKESEKKLKGFSWRIEERPELWQLLNMSEEEFIKLYNVKLAPKDFIEVSPENEDADKIKKTRESKIESLKKVDRDSFNVN